MLSKYRDRKLNSIRLEYPLLYFKKLIGLINKIISNGGFFAKVSVYRLFYKKIKTNSEISGQDLERIRYLSAVTPFWSIVTCVGVFSTILLLKNLYISTLFVIPIIIYVYPLLISELKRAEYLKGLESEMFPFSILLYLNSLLGKGIGTVLSDVKSSNLFNNLKREVELVERDSLINGKSLSMTIKSRSRLLARHILADMYMKVITSEFTGVSLKERTRDIVKELSTSLSELYKDYVERATEITEVIFALFLLFPLTALGFQFLGNGNNILILLLPLGLAPPIILWISIIQPNMGYRVKLKGWQWTALVCSTALLVIPISNLEYRVIGLVLVSQLILYPSYSEIKNSDKIFKDFLNILALVSDYTRLGRGIRQSLLNIDLDNFSGPTFKFLMKLKSLIRESKPLSMAETGNTFLNQLLGVLDILDRKGSDSLMVIHETMNIISELHDSRRRLSSQLRSFSVLALLTPLLLWFTTTSLSFISSTPAGWINNLNLTYSLVIAAVYSKIYKFTLINPPLYLTVVLLSLTLSMIPHPIL